VHETLVDCLKVVVLAFVVYAMFKCIVIAVAVVVVVVAAAVASVNFIAFQFGNPRDFPLSSDHTGKRTHFCDFRLGRKFHNKQR